MRRLCDECANFPKDWPDAPLRPLPTKKAKESDWNYQRRIDKEADALELRPEPVCVAGVRMGFRMPNSSQDGTWGFFKDNCGSFSGPLGREDLTRD
jgi:hypothetical protein